MSPKQVVVYLLLATAFLLFLSSSRPSGRATNRYSIRRLHHYHHDVAFDPLVSKLEHQAKENGLVDLENFKAKVDPTSEEIGVLKEYVGDEGRLNVTERLIYLFPLIDTSPKDGKISLQELIDWNQRQALDRLVYYTERQLKKYDKDGDDAVSLSEFLEFMPNEEIDWNNMNNGKPGWWKELFSIADTDGDEVLTRSELNEFLHPEDSENPNIKIWCQKEKIREMDLDGDGMLSLQEFSSQVHRVYDRHPAHYDDVDNESNNYIITYQHRRKEAEKEFRELDVNEDGYLSPEELKPIMSRLQAGQLWHSTRYSNYLIKQVDDDKDGMLSLEEMLNHHFAFYSAVLEENYENDIEDDEDDEVHDEF